jgi:hypothetical protein
MIKWWVCQPTHYRECRQAQTYEGQDAPASSMHIMPPYHLVDVFTENAMNNPK